MTLAFVAVFTWSVSAADDQKIANAQGMKWSPGPGSIPKGAEFTDLHGDPSKEGLFVMRLKPAKELCDPAAHSPKPEIVTVVSGTFKIGMGETADKSKATPLAGGFFAFPPGMTHFAFTDEETVFNSTARECGR